MLLPFYKRSTTKTGEGYVKKIVIAAVAVAVAAAGVLFADPVRRPQAHMAPMSLYQLHQEAHLDNLPVQVIEDLI